MWEVIQNPFFAALIVILLIGLGYALSNTINIPAYLFFVMAGMGAYFEISGLQSIAFLKAALVSLLIMALLFNRLRHGQRVPIVNLAWVGLLIIVVTMSTWANQGSFEPARAYLGTLMLAVVVALSPTQERTVKNLTWMIALWGGICFVATLFQWAGHGWTYSSDAIHTGFRTDGLMGTSTMMGIYYAVSLNATHVLFLQTRRWPIRLILMCLGIALAMGLLGTLTRAALLGWAISFLFIQHRLRGMRPSTIVGLVFLGITVIGIAAMLGLGSLVAERIAVVNVDPSAQSRMPLIEAALAFFDKNPWFGLGISQGALGSKDIVLNSHNTLVQRLLETGIVGTMIFLIIIWLSMRGMAISIRREGKRSPVAAYYTGFLGSMLSILVMGLFHDFSYLMVLWIIAGVGLMVRERGTAREHEGRVVAKELSGQRRQTYSTPIKS